MKEYPLSDHFDGSEFYSTPKIESLSVAKTFAHILWGRTGQWPTGVEVPEQKIADSNCSGIQITWIGHATALIHIAGYTVLTDPVWSDRVGPTPWTGAQRVAAPGIRFEDLPNIDIVVISHDHYDHLDLPTLRTLEDRFHPIFVVPLGIEQTLDSLALKEVHALDWWESFRWRDSLSIHVTPAQHNSGRFFFDKNKSLWGSFVIESPGSKVYFAGDTAWGNHFEKIFARFGPIDVALLPIGAYKPEENMSRFHISPKEAVQAATVLHSSLSVPIHYDTFQLTAEDYGEASRDLWKALAGTADPKPMFVSLKPGEPVCSGVAP